MGIDRKINPSKNMVAPFGQRSEVSYSCDMTPFSMHAMNGYLSDQPVLDLSCKIEGNFHPHIERAVMASR